MTTEERDLLMKDLCGRVPYKVKIKVRSNDIRTVRAVDMVEGVVHFVESDSISPFGVHIEHPMTFRQAVKPFLRPMSSMTDEEDLEFIGIGLLVVNYGTNGNAKHKCKLSIPEIDWLNARHFDYRGLIGMGLALEAPEGMYGEHKNGQI